MFPGISAKMYGTSMMLHVITFVCHWQTVLISMDLVDTLSVNVQILRFSLKYLPFHVTSFKI